MAQSPSAVDLAIVDLAAAQGVDASWITVVAVDDVTWASSALGCPQPGLAYVQVLTAGKRIVLQLGETTYEYHSAGNVVVICDQPEPPLDVPPIDAPIILA